MLEHSEDVNSLVKLFIAEANRLGYEADVSMSTFWGCRGTAEIMFKMAPKKVVEEEKPPLVA